MDPQDRQPRSRLNQQAALDELERFGRDIQRYRAQREALGDEFETFVRGFKTPPEPAAGIPAPPVMAAPRVSPAPPVPPVAPAPAVPAPAPVMAVPPRSDPMPETPVFETPTTEVSPPAMAAPPEPIARPVQPARPDGSLAAIAATAAILVGGGLLAAFLWNRGPEPAADPAPNPDAAAAATPAAAPTPAPAAASPVRTAPAPPSAASEIVTEKQVWMRVVVDGEKVLEREVPAGTKIPLNAEKTIVIRTGNAGAVRLSLRGGPGTLVGREGEVVTRSFTVPSRRP